MKSVLLDFAFSFPWENVVSAFLRRYPNPFSTHVLTEDTLSTEVRGDGELHVVRVLTKTNRMPRWGERLTGARHVVIIERIVVDMKKRVLAATTVNLGLKRIMHLEEQTVFASDNGGQTRCKKSAFVSSSLFGVKRALEAFGAHRYQHNAERASRGLQWVLEHRFRL